ncbi:MAG: tetratricopeptide repeat protein [Myxococcales bacterium]|nr:tetratricopeptide repeat protein [Myxococcales bacterium]MCB9642910.1 tetratricopeptide repeat protein [Myxococcales bacterium]
MSEETLIGIVEVPRLEAKLLLESAYFYIEMGKYKEAQDVFEGCVALLPRSDVPRIGLGNLFVAQGRFDLAETQYREAIKINEGSASAHAFLAESLLFQKKFPQATPSLEKAIALDPDGPAGQLARSLQQGHADGVFG